MFLMCFTICIWGGGVMMNARARERKGEKEEYVRVCVRVCVCARVCVNVCLGVEDR